MPIEELKKFSYLELENLTPECNSQELESSVVRYATFMSNTVAEMKRESGSDPESLCFWIAKVNEIMIRAWRVPKRGHEIGNTLCDVLRKNGGLDILIENCVVNHATLRFQSAKLLQQCLVTANRGYVVEKGLDKVIEVAKVYTENISSNLEEVRVGTGILEHLFKHSETTCSDVIAMGGLGKFCLLLIKYFMGDLIQIAFAKSVL